MKVNMVLSVALCTYNGEKFLDQQLQSILNQSLEVNEIIICDDISKDDTVTIVKKYQLDFPGIIKLHINEVSLGAIKNFEKAISLCIGDIIFLSDQDDVWIKNKVEKIINKFKEEPKLEAIFSDAELIDKDGSLLNKTLFDEYHFKGNLQEGWVNGGALLDLVYFRNKITGATLAFKKDLFNRAFPFTKVDRLWHDAYLGLHAAANSGLGWINEPLIRYRIHSNQQVGIGNGTTINNSLNTTNSKAFLTDLRTFFSNCLIIGNEIAEKYPRLNKKMIVKEAADWIHFIDLRLHLPTNIFYRTFTVINNIKAYKRHSKFFIKPMIKDFIRPCK